MGHWYNNETLSSDPWAIIGYATADMNGYGQFANCVHTGFDISSDPSLLEGRAFVIHAEDGSRVSCGLIQKKQDLELTVSVAETAPIPGSTQPMGDTGVTGLVSVLSNLAGDNGVTDGVCYQGYASNLEPDIENFFLGAGSRQCNVTNGCGVHIHAGTGCETTEEQGGHYYDSDELFEDPWLLASYQMTDAGGAGAFVGCVLTGSGAMEYVDKPFVVHGEDGSRLSCGLLEMSKDIDTGNSGSAAHGVSLTISLTTSSFVASVAALAYFS